LRETKRRNRDGTTVSYLQLAHSERHPVTGVPSAKVIHNFGRADTVDRDALARLVASISRFLDPQQAIAAAHAGEIEVLDSRRVGGAWGSGDMMRMAHDGEYDISTDRRGARLARRDRHDAPAVRSVGRLSPTSAPATWSWRRSSLWKPQSRRRTSPHAPGGDAPPTPFEGD
jgi:hypothetical protein